MGKSMNATNPIIHGLRNTMPLARCLSSRWCITVTRAAGRWSTCSAWATEAHVTGDDFADLLWRRTDRLRAERAPALLPAPAEASPDPDKSAQSQSPALPGPPARSELAAGLWHS